MSFARPPIPRIVEVFVAEDSADSLGLGSQRFLAFITFARPAIPCIHEVFVASDSSDS